jgi:hypothetical protein
MVSPSVFDLTATEKVYIGERAASGNRYRKRTVWVPDACFC